MEQIHWTWLEGFYAPVFVIRTVVKGLTWHSPEIPFTKPCQATADSVLPKWKEVQTQGKEGGEKEKKERKKKGGGYY